MEIDRVAPALQQRLGPEATVALLTLFDTARQEWAADVMVTAVDRFERRLSEESARLRVLIVEQTAEVRQEMAEQGAQLRREMAEQGAQLRREMAEQGAQLRCEMAEQGAQLRCEMAEQGAQLRQDLGSQICGVREDMAEFGARLRQELATSRVELFKWSFVFWIGQVVAMSAIMALMLRLTGH